MGSTKTPPSPPNEEALHEAALGYLAQRSASVAQMTRVLQRKLDAWARRAARAGVDADEIAAERARAAARIDGAIARLRRAGLVDDARYAAQRAGSLTRAGKSRRAITFDLAQRGVAREIVRDAVPDDREVELLAAVTLTRKRRLGPFAREPEATREERHRWMGTLARAGFSFDVAERALRMDREAAEELLRGSRPLGW